MMPIDKSAFYQKIDDLLELPSGSVKGSTALADTEEWDSLAVITFIAMVDGEYSISLPANEIANCGTIDDLAALVEKNQPA